MPDALARTIADGLDIVALQQQPLADVVAAATDAVELIAEGEHDIDGSPSRLDEGPDSSVEIFAMPQSRTYTSP